MCLYEQISYKGLFSTYIGTVSGQFLFKENCLPVRVGVWVKVRVGFRVGGNQRIAPPVSVRVWLRVRGGQFSSAVIALEPFGTNQE